jgi:hypothetical protein
LAALIAVLLLAFAAAAVAYTLPKPPGTSGGPPTPPKTTSGNKPASTTAAGKTTATGATAIGTKLAALTNLELATQGTFTVTVSFPAGGSMLARVTAPTVGMIGQGFAGRANKGTEPLSLTFTAKGIAFLIAHAATPETLTIKLTFTANKGGKATSSTVTVTTA